MGAMPANDQGEGPLRYSEKLSPAVNQFLIEASRQDVRVGDFIHELFVCIWRLEKPLV